MRRISSSIAFLLLIVLPLQMQMGCSTAITAMEGYQLVRQLDRAQKHPYDYLKEGQKVRVHYTDENEKEQRLKGHVKEVTEEAVVIAKKTSKITVEHTEIPYHRIHKIEMLDDKLGKTITVLRVATAVATVVTIVVIIWGLGKVLEGVQVSQA
ncbi:MAG: hypothetical protein OXH81_14235 [Gemmatimonadetes bacterium]|nr:hypothetical protein [Gemmatimonadota bacterium]